MDGRIIELLTERVNLAAEVGRVKRESGGEFYVPSREEQVFRSLAERSHALDSKLSEEAIRHIWREIISASIALEKPLTVAYLGPEATFTEQAALKNFGSSLKYQPLGTIPDVFNAVSQRDADYGVIPIENSTGGAVFHSLDMLAETELKIIAQVYLDIVHCLISRSPLGEIREVRSKDQALVQCRDWLRRHLPDATQEECESTALAVRQAGELPGVAAVASTLAADRYGVPVVAEAIQDRSDNVTRFLVIGRECSPPTGLGLDRTSMVFSIRDDVGALGRVLEAFSSRNINLMKIESRPSRKKAWDYLFFVDFVGHWHDAIVQEVAHDLEGRCPFVKWLGSYPMGMAR